MIERRGPSRPLAAILAVALLCLAGAMDAGARERVEPAGLWYCLVYGHLQSDDWHMSLRLGPEGRASAAWGLAVGNRGWRRLSNWTVKRGVISFTDPQTRREFEGDLARSTLGGTWRADARSGGWWCAPRPPELAAEAARLTPSDAAMAAPLVARMVKAPDYPREAIRKATEGRAVVCFLVDRNGFVVEPEVVELSDEVFRDPTLEALAQSRFDAADEAVALRPGCRSYVYNLTSAREADPE